MTTLPTRGTSTATPTTASANLLRRALRSNSACSLAVGALLAVAPGTVGGWLGVSVDGWLRLFGLVLVVHGALLGWVASRPDPRALGRLNLMAIAPYPLAMVVLVLTGLIDRPLGQGLVLADGAVIGVVAWAHWVGLRSSDPTAHDRAA